MPNEKFIKKADVESRKAKVVSKDFELKNPPLNFPISFPLVFHIPDCFFLYLFAKVFFNYIK